MLMYKELTTNLECQGKRKISIKKLREFNSNIFIDALITEFLKINKNEDFLFYLKVSTVQYDFAIKYIPEEYVVNRDLVGEPISDSDCYRAYYMIPRESENCYE